MTDKPTIINIAALMSLVMMCGFLDAAEIKPFKVTGVEGEVFVQYYNDEYIDKNAGIETSRREGVTTQEGLDLTIHSYVYHPNLFRLDFGGGPVFYQYDYDSNVVQESDSDNYFNLRARASILEKKPYPLVLYYDKHSNITPYAVQDRMLLTSETYGMGFKLKKPVIPALVQLDLKHSEVDGRNLQRITDEKTDRASVDISGDLGANGDGRIGYSWTKRESGSGSVTLPITETTRTIQLFDARTDHSFGDDEWIRFVNLFKYKLQDTLPDLVEFRYMPRLTLTHSNDLRSYYNYNYTDRTVNEIDTTTHALNLGATHTSFDKRLETSIDFHADRYKTEGFEEDYYHSTLNLGYLQPYDTFNIRYSGSWGYDYTKRVGDEVVVVAEVYTLDSFNAFELNNSNVIQSTIVIKNESQTQTFIEGIHYELITIADITKVQWIDLDDIPESVVVDYSYESGGTADFDGFRQLYRIDLTRGDVLRLFAKYRSVDRNLQSGDPTIPLNSYETKTLGMKVDYPLQNDWTIGGNAEHEDHDADVGSYRRDSAGVYLEIPKVLKGNLRLFADKLLVDYLESSEDIDIDRYGVRYLGRLWNRTTLSAHYVDETDTGGSVERSNTRARVKLGWDYRQLSLSAEARYYTDQLGQSERERSSINMTLTRRF